MATLTVPGFGSVTYKEIPGSPREQMTGNTWRVTRTFDVPHVDRWLFLLGMFGNASLVSADPGTGMDFFISRITPTPYEISIGGLNSSFMYPTSVESIEPQGVAILGSFEVASYPLCRITIGYEAPHYTVLEDDDPVFILNGSDEASLCRFVSIFIQPTAEYLTLPYGTYFWANFEAGVYKKGEPVIGSQAKLISSNEVQVIWHMVPGIPQAAYNSIGTVNQYTFADPHNKVNAPPGTLLLTQMEARPYRWIFGNFLYDITYKFKFFNPTDPTTGLQTDEDGNPIGHNHFLKYRPNDIKVPVYRYLTHNGLPPAGAKHPGAPTPGTPVYLDSDFALLFQAPLN